MARELRDITADPALALLSVSQMAAADAAAMAGGIAGTRLMAAAGNAVFEAMVNRFPPQPTIVLAGPGNNGGDAYVVAEKLRRADWPVTLAALTPPATLKGDAAWAAAQFKGPVTVATGQGDLAGHTLVVDGLFGAGLARPLDGVARALVEAINRSNLDCIGIDVPSGVDGDSGQVLGAAPACRLSVTFFRPKPGHLLLPGRALCGELVVADIGIPAPTLDAIRPMAFRNGPGLWRRAWPTAGVSDHKYTRGAVLVVAGAGMTGAARLAAAAARRIGAGLLSIAAPDATTAAVLRAAEPGVIVRETKLGDQLGDGRLRGVLLGPGGGATHSLRENVLAALSTGVPTVLDADALTVFADEPQALFNAISGPCLLTPHEGEFERIFKEINNIRNKLDKVRKAAEKARATVLLKGADTVIADPSGMAVINDNAPPSLATAGSGDVLAGFAIGLIAQGLTPLAAASAAAWVHGVSARSGPQWLIAEDLVTGSAHTPL